MSKPKSYRVSVVTWDVHDIWLEAKDQDHAEDQARKLWDCNGRDQFKHRHGEIDCVEAEEVLP